MNTILCTMDQRRQKKKKMRKFSSRRNRLSSAAKFDLSGPSEGDGFDVSMATNLFEESMAKNLNWANTEALAEEDTTDEATADDDESAIFLFPDVYEMGRIRDKFESGVRVKARKNYTLRGKATEYVFSGQDAVNFLFNNGYANTRENALNLGRMLAYEFALFTHITNDYDLEDTNYLYKFIPHDQRLIYPSGHGGVAFSMKYIAEAFEEGIEVNKNSFTGRDAVTFLVNSNMAKTRQDAVRVGSLLMDKFGLYEHVSQKHSFKDKTYTYKFVPQAHRNNSQNIARRVSLSIEDLSVRFQEVVKPGHDSFKLQHYTFSGEMATDEMIRAGLAASRSEAICLGQMLLTHSEIKCIQGGDKAFFDRPNVYYCYADTSFQRSGRYGEPDHGVMYEVMEEEIEMEEEDSVEEEEEEAVYEEQEHEERTEEGEAASEDDEPKSGVQELAGIDESDLSQMNVEKLIGVNLPARSQDGPDELEDLSQMNVEKLIQDIAGGSYGNLPTRSEGGSTSYDKFGFIVEGDDTAIIERRKSQDTSDTVEPLDVGGWGLLLDSCALSSLGEPPEGSQETIKYYMRLGLPDKMRARAWSVISAVNLVIGARDGDYQSIVEEAMGNSNQICEQIEKDLRRTFPSHYLFHSQTEEDDLMNSSFICEDLDPDGVESLRRILNAYALYDDQIGYCQGMNFIAATCLTFLPEEESFWLLVAIMNDDPYCMRELFTTDMAGSLETLFVADRLVKKLLPDLHQHLENEGINISMFATQWLMTIFSSSFDFDLVSKVWDNFLVEGWKVVYRVFIAILASCEQDLLNLPFEHILTFLRDKLPSRIDGQTILSASLGVRLRSRHIRKYTKEFRMMQSQENFKSRRSSSGSSGVKNAKQRGKDLVRKLTVGS